MITPFCDRFIEKKEDTIRGLIYNPPSWYDDLFTRLIGILTPDPDDYDMPDPNRITIIDHGDYQGTRLFIVGATGYQPYTYWACKVSYGSCSGCDSFKAIQSRYWEYEITDEQKREIATSYWTMMLHMVQNMVEI